MTDVFTAHHVIEYPGGYTRSVGPVIGRFLTGLRDGRILAVRLADGRVLVPPTEYDPSTSAAVVRRGRPLDRGRAARHRAVVHVGCAAPRRQARARQAVRVRADPARRRRHRDVARRRLRQRRRDPRRVARRAAVAGRAHRFDHRHRGVDPARRRRGARAGAAARAGRGRTARHRHHRADPARVRAHRRAWRPVAT